jgi:Tfp pilus assembly protein PilV
VKSLISLLLVANAVCGASASFAATPQSESRTRVRAELAQLEQAGYDPAHPGPDYPADLQAAIARSEAGHGAQADSARESSTANVTRE